MRYIIFLLLFSCLYSGLLFGQLAIQTTPDSIHISNGQQSILTYHMATVHPPEGLASYYQRSGFIHPVYSPDGQILTDDFPTGHPHQHGLFLAFTNTRFRGQEIDFWNQQKGQGTIRFDSLLSVQDSGDYVQFTSYHSHLAFINGDTVAALGEEWRVRVYTPSPHPKYKLKYFVIDFESEIHCATDDTLFVNEYHYGGFAIRGSGRWNDPDFEQPKDSVVEYIGKQDKGAIFINGPFDRLSANHQKTQLVAMEGSIMGADCGLAVISHQSNFRHPQSVRIHPTMPYFCYAPMVEGPFEIVPGKSYRSAYRIITYSGIPDLRILAEYLLAYQNQSASLK